MNNPDPNAPQVLKPAVDPAAAPAVVDPATSTTTAPTPAPAPVATPVPPKPFVPPTPAPAAATPVAAPVPQKVIAPTTSAKVAPQPPAPAPVDSSIKKEKEEKKELSHNALVGVVAMITFFFTFLLFVILYFWAPIPASKITKEINEAQLETKAAKAEVEKLVAENKAIQEKNEKTTADEKSAKAHVEILMEEKDRLAAANTALVVQVNEAWSQWTELNTQTKMAAATQALKKPVAAPAPAPSKSGDEEFVRVTVEADGTRTTSSGFRRYQIPRTPENLAKMTNGDPEGKLGFDRKNKVWRFPDQDPRDGMPMEEFKRWAQQEAAARGKKNFRFVEGEKTRAAIQAGADPFDRPVR